MYLLTVDSATSIPIINNSPWIRGAPHSGFSRFMREVAETGPDTALAMYHILQAGGLGSGGLNFDAKVRRQSIDAIDLFHGHIGGMDVAARGLLAAEQMMLDRRLEAPAQVE